VKILVLTSRFPFPLEKGDKLRIYNQMRELARAGHEIVLIALADEPVSDAYLNEIKQFCSRVYVYKLTKMAIYGNILRNILRGPLLPFQVAYFFNSTIKSQIKDVIAAENPDHIYCHLVRMSEYVADADVPKTLDFMDAFGAGTARRSDISNFFLRPAWRFEARLMLDYEKNIATKFNHLTIISEQDRARLPITTRVVSIVGNGVDVDYFSLFDFNKKQLETIKNNLEIIKNELELSDLKTNKNELINEGSSINKHELITNKNNVEINRNTLINSELDAITNELEFIKNNTELNKKNELELIKNNNDLIKRYDVCFVGNLGYYSNVEAVRYLVKNIFPLLKKAKPDVKILIAGARPTDEIRYFTNENITVLGWMDDIREAYSASRILVAPLMHGIGQQNKILEAMAMHVPVVATSRVNNAIGATPETEILVADTEGSFAEQILRLLQNIDLQRLMANNGRTFVENKYSWREATVGLEGLISEK
jgi:glycosyltransferase involved in cell wall biosynthesis